jgi:hypothetical protein
VLPPPPPLLPKWIYNVVEDERTYGAPWRSSQYLWCLSGDSWELPVKLWRFPQACTGLVTALKCPIVHRVFHLGERAWGEYDEPPWCLGSLVPPHYSNGD